MSLSLLIRKIVVCLLLATGTSGWVLAQNLAPNYTPNGGEYPVAGVLFGTQVHPAVSVATNGGFAVWEDNTIDGNGVGIRAAALDFKYSLVSSSFRVNTLGARDQEHPRVAVFNGGGAAFVWQGGRAGFQKTFARFMSSANAWLTGDIPVSTATRNSQRDPVVAVLANGNVIVVWSSYNQAGPGSMQDIYGALFTPAGQKIGDEFLINQTIAYNQRSPSVSALSGGGFVVTWISELQRSGSVDNVDPATGLHLTITPSVDVVGRIFDGSGSPINSEFVVNTGNDACGSPSAAGGADGGFLISWDQKDSLTRSNSWDIYARIFTRIGLAGASFAVNGDLFGDQYFSSASAIGSQYMLVWTSLGQDGSREGVYGRLVNSDSTFGGSEVRINTTTIGSQMHAIVGSDGSARFFTLWAGYTKGTADFDIYGQLHAPPGYAAPQTASIFAPPVSDPFMTNSSNPAVEEGTTRKLNFPLQPAGSITSVTKGAYQGLFYEASGVTATSAGYFSAAATDKGGFTAKILQRGRTYSFTGKFDYTGQSSNQVKRAGSTPLQVQLQLVAGTDQIRGTLSDGTWQADLVADRLIFDRRTNSAPTAGTYTFVIPTDPPGIVTPGGDGFGTVKVDAGGNVLVAATLADGSKLAQRSAVSKQGIWPMYGSLSSGNGGVFSWIQFSSQADRDLGGQVVWIKPIGGTSKYYPAGFVTQVPATGSKYTPPAAGAKALQITSGTLLLSGGGLSQPLSFPITIGANNKVVNNSTNKLMFTIASTTGLFRGSTVNPDTHKPLTFQGALLEKANGGAGFFLGTNQSGQVLLGPAQ